MSEELVEALARRMNRVRREAYLTVDPLVEAPAVERAAAITKAEVEEIIRQMEWARAKHVNDAWGYGEPVEALNDPLTLAPEDWKP